MEPQGRAKNSVQLIRHFHPECIQFIRMAKTMVMIRFPFTATWYPVLLETGFEFILFSVVKTE